MTMLWMQTVPLIAPLFAGGSAEEQTGSNGISITSLFEEGWGVLDNLRVGGLLRAAADYAGEELSEDDDGDGVGDEDIAAVRLYDAQLWFAAELAGYLFFVKMDGAETTAFPPITNSGEIDFNLFDAYVCKGFAERFHFYFGQYKCPLLMSSSVGDGALAMIDRTRLGYLFAFPGAYQPGVAVTFDEGPFHAKLSVANGFDDETDGFGIVARGEYAIGSGAKYREGAQDSEDFNATFGIGYFTDDGEGSNPGSPDDEFGSALALDAYTTYDMFSLHAEIVDMDEELAFNALGNTDDDATPYSATAGYLFDPQWEGFVRWQDLDNEVDATIIGAGVNYYVMGHKLKWQANVSQYEDDDIDDFIAQLGISIGLSEPSLVTTPG
jgi:hypothetical protein